MKHFSYAFLIAFAIPHLSARPAAAQGSSISHYRSLDSFRYSVFVKDTAEIRKRLPAIQNAPPAHYNDLLLQCQAQLLLKDYQRASDALAGAVAWGMDTGYIRFKGRSISQFRIRQAKIDSAYSAHQAFQKRNKILLDSQFYFLANDLRLYGNGNERGELARYLSGYMDTGLRHHRELQNRLSAFILRQGWIGYRRTHRSELLLPVAHLDLAHLVRMRGRLLESLRSGEMLPDEFGFIDEKIFQLSKALPSGACKYAPAGFDCREAWSPAIRNQRHEIGMSTFFRGNSGEVFLEDLEPAD